MGKRELNYIHPDVDAPHPPLGSLQLVAAIPLPFVVASLAWCVGWYVFGWLVPVFGVPVQVACVGWLWAIARSLWTCHGGGDEDAAPTAADVWRVRFSRLAFCVGAVGIFACGPLALQIVLRP